MKYINIRLFIILFFIVFIIIGYFEQNNQKNKIKEQLNDIGNPDFFFMIPDLIPFFASIQDIGCYDNKAYHLSITECNNICKTLYYIQEDPYKEPQKLIEPINMYLNNAINALHSISVSSNTPSAPIIQKKIGTSMGILQNILVVFTRDFYRQHKIQFDSGPPGLEIDDLYNPYEYVKTHVDNDLIK
jgi:hypothetical protein